MKIQGSVAIVTGGAQGIGEKICTALLDEGCKVTYPFKTMTSKLNLKVTSG